MKSQQNFIQNRETKKCTFSFSEEDRSQSYFHDGEKNAFFTGIMNNSGISFEHVEDAGAEDSKRYTFLLVFSVDFCSGSDPDRQNAGDVPHPF